MIEIANLESALSASGHLTVGLEEEMLLLDPETLLPAPIAAQVLEQLADPGRFKAELPAAQIEATTAPRARLGDALDDLAGGRRAILEAAGGARAAAIPLHPFADPLAELNQDPVYERTRTEYGPVARLQLVSALHVHVAPGGAEHALSIYNALRSHLPELMALAANGPFHAGSDTGLATMRPKIAELLPRQGVPPAFDSLEAYAGALGWSAAAGAAPKPRYWWWETRIHPLLGTIEVRVADAQESLADAGAVAAVIACLIAWLRDRDSGGEQLPVVATHRIEENRWSAIRHGVEGSMADLETGETEPTGERLRRLIESIEPYAEQFGCQAQLGRAKGLTERNGAIRQREMAAAGGGDLVKLTRGLADRFEAGLFG